MDYKEGVQLNKYISSSGFCSRREADKLIEQGRVTLNNKVATVTMRVADGDKVFIDDELLRVKKKEGFYIAFNKPKGITSTTDIKDKTNIISYINHNRRIFPVGRLDKDSEGLILLTDDGDIVNKILRSENENEKEYVVSVNKPIVGEFVNKMSSGIPLDEGITKPCKVRLEGSKKFRIVLTQGLNRQIRRMTEYMGYEVLSLKRIRIMNIRLGDIPVGKFRILLPSEVRELIGQVAVINSKEPEFFPEKPAKSKKKPFVRNAYFRDKDNAKKDLNEKTDPKSRVRKGTTVEKNSKPESIRGKDFKSTGRRTAGVKADSRKPTENKKHVSGSKPRVNSASAKTHKKR